MQPPNKPTTAKSTSPFQFKLRTLFLVVAYISFMLGWLRWFEIDRWWKLHPGYYGLCAVGLIVFAVWTNPVRDRSSSAWNFFIAGWYWTAVNLAYGFFLANQSYPLTHIPQNMWAVWY